jgi:RNA-directed DNA polymerase
VIDLKAPKTKLDDLRERLYFKAKNEPECRFYSLYDKIHRWDVLLEALKQSKANKGAPGVDGQTFEKIETLGEENWLRKLQVELEQKTYRPQPVRRVLIPKPDGGQRPLGIPTIKDRVAQTAAKLILEPIFEADLSDAAYGYRVGRSATQAAEKVSELLKLQKTNVVDADLSGYFDTIPHAELMKCLARRISDGAVLHLLKQWLKVPVEERDENNRPRTSGGKRSTQGTPQGGVISPLLANIYINQLLGVFAKSAAMKAIGAEIVNYADDFVVLCNRNATGALAQIRAWLTQMKLTLNESKTSVKNAWLEPFVFLGYQFGPERYFGTKRWYLGRRPSNKALKAVREKVSKLLHRGRPDPWEDIRDELNDSLRGWLNYFCYGTTPKPFAGVAAHVVNRVRNFLRRRHGLPRGSLPMKHEEIYGEHGVMDVMQVWRTKALR